jgi:hypothetical protein
MTNFNNLCPIEAVFLEYSFSKFNRIVDIGGGLGSFAAAAMQVTPTLQGHLFDLPNVITEAKQVGRDVLCEALRLSAPERHTPTATLYGQLACSPA